MAARYAHMMGRHKLRATDLKSGVVEIHPQSLGVGNGVGGVGGSVRGGGVTHNGGVGRWGEVHHGRYCRRMIICSSSSSSCCSCCRQNIKGDYGSNMGGWGGDRAALSDEFYHQQQQGGTRRRPQQQQQEEDHVPMKGWRSRTRAMAEFEVPRSTPA